VAEKRVGKFPKAFLQMAKAGARKLQVVERQERSGGCGGGI